MLRASRHALAECLEPGLHCEWHGVDEPDNGAYRVCGECWHVFSTEMDLRQAWAEGVEEAWGTRIGPEDLLPADQIHYCPLCAHDF